MVHVDLFSGIGGFAYAADQVFGDVTHIFCDSEPFAQAVLKKHWPESEIYEDVRKFRPRVGRVDLLTGGFPCQPFSAAGVRRGTNDERYLWPAMLEVIQYCKPTWVIAENVGGLLTWNEGLVFETVCSDLESAGYEVQPLIIPAAAVGAPHRRDRIWFIGHANSSELDRAQRRGSSKEGSSAQEDRSQDDTARQSRRADQHISEDWQPNGHEQPAANTDDNGHRASGRQANRDGKTRGEERKGQSQPRASGSSINDTNTSSTRRQRGSSEDQGRSRLNSGNGVYQRPDWSKDWLEVATQFCSVDDVLPVKLDGFELSKSKHRREQLKAYGNAIVPQVAMEIMRGMRDVQTTKETNRP